MQIARNAGHVLFMQFRPLFIVYSFYPTCCREREGVVSVTDTVCVTCNKGRAQSQVQLWDLINEVAQREPLGECNEALAHEGPRDVTLSLITSYFLRAFHFMFTLRGPLFAFSFFPSILLYSLPLLYSLSLSLSLFLRECIVICC